MSARTTAIALKAWRGDMINFFLRGLRTLESEPNSLGRMRASDDVAAFVIHVIAPPCCLHWHCWVCAVFVADRQALRSMPSFATGLATALGSACGEGIPRAELRRTVTHVSLASTHSPTEKGNRADG